MNTLVKNWQTSVVGLVAGALLFASQQYQPGMSWKSYGSAIAVALLGILSKDHSST